MNLVFNSTWNIDCSTVQQQPWFTCRPKKGPSSFCNVLIFHDQNTRAGVLESAENTKDK